MKTSFCILLIILLFAMTGCDTPGWKWANTQGSKQKKTKADKQEKQAMKQKITVTGSPYRVPVIGEPDILPVVIESNGARLEVPAGAKAEIESETLNQAEESMNNEAAESMTSETKRKPGLPWGVYVAVIVLVAGGAIVTVKLGASWGLPLIAAGVLVYGVFVVVNTYPGVVTIVIGVLVVGAVFFYARHGLSFKSKANAISAFKRAVNNANDHVSAGIKTEIKKVVGDSANPARKDYEREVNNG